MADLDRVIQGQGSGVEDLGGALRLLEAGRHAGEPALWTRGDVLRTLASDASGQPAAAQVAYLEIPPLDFGQGHQAIPKGVKRVEQRLAAHGLPLPQPPEVMVAAAAVPPVLDAREAERQAKAKFDKQSPVERVATVISRMPENASLHLDGQKLTLETNFGQLFESMPGVRLDAKAWQTLNNLKGISLERDRFTAELARPSTVQGFELNAQGITLGELQLGDVRNPRLTFNVAFDAATGTAALSEIEGLRISSAGGILKFPITRLELSNNNGQQEVSATVKIGQRDVTIALPSNQAFPGLEADMLKRTVGALSDLKTVLNTRELGQVADRIPEQGLRDLVKNLFKGIKSVDKTGDLFVVTRDNGFVNYDAGGARVTISSSARFRVGQDADRPGLTDVQGLTVSFPLPEQIGLGNRYTASIKSLDLGVAEVDGSRNLTVAADNLVEKLSMRVDKNLVPVLDASNNYNVNLVVANPLSDRKGDHLDIALRLSKDGQLKLDASEIADMISRATWQAADSSFSGAGLAVMAGGSKLASWGASAYRWLFK